MSDVHVNLSNMRLYTVVCDEKFIIGAPKRGRALPKAKFKNTDFCRNDIRFLRDLRFGLNQSPKSADD